MSRLQLPLHEAGVGEGTGGSGGSGVGVGGGGGGGVQWEFILQGGILDPNQVRLPRAGIGILPSFTPPAN